jgi:hypothetical protein
VRTVRPFPTRIDTGTRWSGSGLADAAYAVFSLPDGQGPARAAIRAYSSFNLVDTAHGLKVDFFVLGDGLRMKVTIPGFANGIWVTARQLDLGALLDDATNAANLE